MKKHRVVRIAVAVLGMVVMAQVALGAQFGGREYRELFPYNEHLAGIMILVDPAPEKAETKAKAPEAAESEWVTVYEELTPFNDATAGIMVPRKVHKSQLTKDQADRAKAGDLIYY